ncbi:unnamed protein product [Paramecium pentaurelia]|uniref:Uncharacterized protein n=1 Tax=Paramecium pentaurelia TaxID=43138 RepID=A0A8S1UEF1_9CILI|nr:unnamed protein product [Paramecium pentaurelia]
MNTETQSEKQDQRRSKRERYVGEALNAVQKWRDLFENGYYDEVGNYLKPTLKEAADLVGLPKRSLEQYYSVFRKIPQSIDIMRFLDKKMGNLNQFIKELKNESAITQVKEKEEEQEQNSWDNMIIEADDQLAVQREIDDEPELQQILQQQQYYENEDDYIKYLQLEEDQKYCSEYYFYDENDDYFMRDDFNNPALPD